MVVGDFFVGGLDTMDSVHSGPDEVKGSADSSGDEASEEPAHEFHLHVGVSFQHEKDLYPSVN